MKRYLVFFLFISIGLHEVKAQNNITARDSVAALKLEYTRNHELKFVLTGKTIRYKVHGSEHIVKGKILEITDSTFSLQKAKMERVTIAFKDLERLILPRSNGRQAFGYFTLAFATASIIVGAALTSGGTTGAEDGVNAVFDVAASLGYLNAYFLLRGKRIYLRNGWTMKKVYVVRH